MKQDSNILAKKALLAFFGSFVVLSIFDVVIRPEQEWTLNNGYLFGFFPGGVSAIIISFLLLAFLIFIAKKRNDADYIILGLCCGSVLVNLVERIRFMGVIDYIPLFAGIHCNIADIIIVATVILIFWRKIADITQKAL